MMTEKLTISKPKTPREWQSLKYRKLFTFAIIITFLAHALPSLHFPEVYPLTRWTMFSGSGSIPENYVQTSIHVFDANDSTHILELRELYSGIGISSNNFRRNGFLSGALVDDAGGQQVRNAVIDHLNKRLQIDVALVEIWVDSYPVDATNMQGFVDFEQVNSVHIATFSRNEVQQYYDYYFSGLQEETE